MKNKIAEQRTVELDVDFIGGQGALTKEEEKQISEFIQSQKKMRTQMHNRTKAIQEETFA